MSPHVAFGVYPKGLVGIYREVNVPGDVLIEAKDKKVKITNDKDLPLVIRKVTTVEHDE